MALMRVYCGLAATVPAGPRVDAWLTAAVVDDAGRLLDVCDVTDDATGYADLGAMLAERCGGSEGIAVAADSDEHEITLLLAAAGRPLAIVEEDLVAHYSDQFVDEESDEELNAPEAERGAVGLARALAAGALAATSQGPTRELLPLKPVLAAHEALLASRHSAAAALREVLRELYPAALRAYPDPAEAIPLAILDALPEPSLLGNGTAARNREIAIVAELTGAGVADADTVAGSVTALRLAIGETPRRTAIGKSTTTAVAETIRQAVAAVRACDCAIDALVGLIATKGGAARPTPVLRAVPSESTPARGTPRRGRGGAPVSAEPPTRPTRGGSQRGATTRAASRATGRGTAAVPPPPPPVEAPRSGAPTQSWTAENSGGYPQQGVYRSNGYGQSSVAYPAAGHPPANGSGYPLQPRYVDDGGFLANYPSPNGFELTAGPAPAPAPEATGDGYPTAGGIPSPDFPAPGSRDTWPLVPPRPGDDMAREWTGEPPKWNGGEPPAWNPEPPAWNPEPPVWNEPPAWNEPSWSGAAETQDELAIPRQREGRVAPPWQTDDLSLPDEPPVLRLVDLDSPLPGADDDLEAPTRAIIADRTPTPRDLADRDFGDRGPADRDFGDRGPGDRGFGHRDLDELPRRRRGETYEAPATQQFAPAPPAPADDDLLIFSQTQSAWFVGHTPDTLEPPSWSDAAADAGWSAAERAADPSVGTDTDAGLPRRIPQANLVPGSPLPPVTDRRLHIVRDPASMAAHTTGYFRGSRRGEEVRGYAVGGRPGRESGGGWDFSRDGWEDEQETEYRSAMRR